MQLDNWTLGQVTAVAGYSIGKKLADKHSQVLEVLAKAWPKLDYENGEVRLSSTDERLEAAITPGYARIVAEGVTDPAQFTQVLATHFPAQLWTILGLEKLRFGRGEALVFFPQSDHEDTVAGLLGMLPVTPEMWRLADGPPRDLGISMSFDKGGVNRILWFTPVSAEQLKVEYSMLKDLPASAVHIMAMLTESRTPPSRLAKLAEDAVFFAQRQGVSLLKSFLHSGG